MGWVSFKREVSYLRGDILRFFDLEDDTMISASCSS